MKKTLYLTLLVFLLATTFQPSVEKVTAMPSPRLIMRGKASWYSQKSPGINKRTANNEIFNDQELTCAMWGMSFNRLIRVKNLSNGKSIIVRVNDRGPHLRYLLRGRIIDLTLEAFSRLELPKNGLINVEIELL